jgi:alpha/beta superfamily hydrolase
VVDFEPAGNARGACPAIAAWSEAVEEKEVGMGKGQEEHVWFGGGEVVLEGRLYLPSVPGGPVAGAVVCHPHPLYGGTMDNAVVRAVSKALAARSFAVLRFNFRGVGGSGGEHGGGVAETADVAAALGRLASRPEVDPARLGVAGYSFGAAVGLRAACADSRVGAVALVAPPLAAFPMAEAAACPIPKLAVVGTRDAFCPMPLLEPWFAAAGEPKRRVELSGADHFFSGREEETGEAVAAFFGECFASAAPAGAGGGRLGRGAVGFSRR